MRHCQFETCTNKISLSLYDTLLCKVCVKNFCLKHRMPEYHFCDINFIKNKCKQELSTKLLNEALKNNKLTNI